jgi:hypothetical protein
MTTETAVVGNRPRIREGIFGGGVSSWQHEPGGPVSAMAHRRPSANLKVARSSSSSACVIGASAGPHDAARPEADLVRVA